MQGRITILRELLQLQKNTGLDIITKAELKAIDRMWEAEGDLYRRTLVETYYEIMGERLPWDAYRVPLFSEETMQILESTCKEYDVEYEMMKKLIVAVEQNKHYSRGNKVAKAFDKVVNEGWLHHANIKSAKEDLNNENK